MPNAAAEAADGDVVVTDAGAIVWLLRDEPATSEDAATAVQAEVTPKAGRKRGEAKRASAAAAAAKAPRLYALLSPHVQPPPPRRAGSQQKQSVSEPSAPTQYRPPPPSQQQQPASSASATDRPTAHGDAAKGGEREPHHAQVRTASHHCHPCLIAHTPLAGACLALGSARAARQGGRRAVCRPDAALPQAAGALTRLCDASFGCLPDRCHLVFQVAIGQLPTPTDDA